VARRVSQFLDKKYMTLCLRYTDLLDKRLTEMWMERKYLNLNQFSIVPIAILAKVRKGYSLSLVMVFNGDPRWFEQFLNRY